MLPERRVSEKGPEWQIGIMENTHKQDLWKYMNEWFKVLQYLVTDYNGAIVKGGGKELSKSPVKILLVCLTQSLP